MSANVPKGDEDRRGVLRTVGAAGEGSPTHGAGEWLQAAVPVRRLWLVAGGLALLAAVLAAVVLGVSGGGTSVAQPSLYHGSVTVTDEPTRFWQNLDPKSVTFADAEGVEGTTALHVSMNRPRAFFTVLGHTFAAPRDLAATRWLFLEFLGTGKGASYSFILDYNAEHTKSAVYNFVDTSSGWRVIPFDLLAPGQGDPPTSSDPVVSVRLATPAKRNTGDFTVGRITTSRPQQ